VAGEGTDKQELSEATHEPRECMACRGTGRVISNLGGSPKTVACPWCEGSGLRPPEVDAQAHWGHASDGESAVAGGTEGADGPEDAREREQGGTPGAA
jgi:hypothetical protein